MITKLLLGYLYSKYYRQLFLAYRGINERNVLQCTCVGIMVLLLFLT